MKDLLEYIKENPDIYNCPYNDFQKILNTFEDFDKNVNYILDVFNYENYDK